MVDSIVLEKVLRGNIPKKNLPSAVKKITLLLEGSMLSDPNGQALLWQQFIPIFAAEQISFPAQKALYDLCFAQRKEENGPPPVWLPMHPENTNIGRLIKDKGFETYRELFAWSVEEKNAFWLESVYRIGVLSQEELEDSIALPEQHDVEDPKWFPEKLFNAVDECFLGDPQKIAIISRHEEEKKLHTLTYAQLEALTNQVASGLRQHGFKEGDALAVDMPMNAESVAIYLGIIKAGCTVVSIADSFTPPEIQKRVGIGKAKGIFTVDSFSRAGKEIAMYQKVKEAKCPTAIVLHSSKKTEWRAGDITWEEFLGEETFLGKRYPPQHVTNLLFSSGTTGDPKAIPWTQLTPVKAAVDGYYHHDIQEGDVLCWPTNVGWMMGPWLIYASLINRGTIALYVGAATTKDFGNFVEKAKVTMLGTVPSLVKVWRKSGCMEKCDWSTLKLFSSTGECSNAEDYLYLMSLAHYRAPVVEYCGGTEIGGGYITGTLVQPASPSTFTTPSLGLDLVILDEAGQEVKEGEVGEVFLIPPSIGLSQTLLNRGGKGGHHKIYFADCPKGPEGLVLRRHGDALEPLAGGYYRHHGRADDTMNLGAIKVSSAELETVVNSHGDVYESAAIAVPEKGGGPDQLVLYLVVREGNIEVEELQGTLQTLIRRAINPLFKIFDVILTGSLPRTASGKVMRRVLRKEYLEKRK